MPPCACNKNKNSTTASAGTAYIVVSPSGTQRRFRKKEDAEKFAQRTNGTLKTA